MRSVVMTLVIMFLIGCSGSDNPAPQTPTPPSPPAESVTIKLRWVKAYSAETQDAVNIGVLWGLSFLGVPFPANYPDAVYWQTDKIVIVDIDRAGYVEGTRPAWQRLFAVLKNSEEYRATGAFDIGRFLMLTLCSSHQYFALTGANKMFADFQVKYRFEPTDAAVVESGVATGSRLVTVAAAATVPEIAFIGYEGTGSIPQGTFTKKEIETLDIMTNGQLRFGLYDLSGNLKMGTTPSLTHAGKPAKCLWCHETSLMPPFNNVTDVAGYYTTSEFTEIVRQRMALMVQYRSMLSSLVDHSKLDDHSYAELLYLSFFEPNA